MIYLTLEDGRQLQLSDPALIQVQRDPDNTTCGRLVIKSGGHIIGVTTYHHFSVIQALQREILRAYQYKEDFNIPSWLVAYGEDE